MAELTITYKSKRTLDMLLDLAKYFDFTVSKIRTSSPSTLPYRGVSIVEGDNSVDTSDLREVFTGRNLDARKLRDSEWERRG
jgi:hypothetical protein